MYSSFASCFNDPEHADVLLRVYTDADTDGQEPAAKRARTESEGRPAAPSSAPVARSYHCHIVILSVLSGFFKAQLSSAWQQPTGDKSSTSPTSGSKRAVDIHVEAEELDALHELLQMMYSQKLPSPAPTEPLLLQCLRLADRFEAVSCMELLLAGLAATPSAAMDCTLLDYVFRASPGVCVSRSYPALLESCSKALVRLFGDVPTVIRDEALLQQFCSLPHAAVLAWVKSDDLQVHSENCVVFLLSAWVKANQGSTAEQHEELAHRIRVFHLGPVYLHHILPNLGWFKDCSNMEYLPAVLSCIRAGIKMKEGLEAEKGKMYSTSSFALPPGWCAKPRRSSNSSMTCAWVLNPSLLKEVGEGKAQVLPSPVSINGFLMRLKVQQKTTDSSPAPGRTITMSVFLGVDVAAMTQRGLPLPNNFLVQLEACVQAGSSGSEQRKVALIFSAALYEAAKQWGLTDFLGAAAPTFPELVASYLHAGQLHLEALFSAVDA